MKYFGLFILLALCITSCDLDKWDLDRHEIPNFERSIPDISFVEHFNTGVFQNSEGYYTFLSNGTDVITVGFDLSGALAFSIPLSSGGRVTGATSDSLSDFIIASSGNDIDLIKTDKTHNLIKTQSNFKRFIDTTYNRIDSVQAFDIHFDVAKQELLIAGYVSTFGYRFSMLLATDVDLNPLWMRTHLCGGVNYAINTLSNGSYVISGFLGTEGYVIKDNAQGSDFIKSNTADYTDMGVMDIAVTNDDVFVTGASSSQAKSLKYQSNLAQSFTTTFKSNNSVATHSIINKYGELVSAGYNNTDQTIMCSASPISEAQPIWCNAYDISVTGRTIALLEDESIGYLVLALLTVDDISFYPHLIKTDEEGATRLSPFSDKCE